MCIHRNVFSLKNKQKIKHFHGNILRFILQKIGILGRNEAPARKLQILNGETRRNQGKYFAKNKPIA
jgi:hypothetical protein